MPLISVIVPVFNTAQYLRKCTDSLLFQGFDDFEVILVDDGSTDESGVLCDRLAGENSSRIIAVHQQNAGQGAARNTGLRYARGEYILFVDSDDWLQPGTFSALSEALTSYEADIICFGLLAIDANGNASEQRGSGNAPKLIPLTPSEHPSILIDIPSVCNKLWKKAFLTGNNLEFCPNVWYEDIRFTLKAYIFEPRMVFLPGAFYCYFTRAGSTMRNVNEERNKEILDAFDDIVSSYKNQNVIITTE